MQEQHKDCAIVKSVVALAHALDIEVVAEGVERESTLALLRRMGCDIAQGYRIGHPVSATDVNGTLALLR